ncbi:hypothetical protein [Halobellus inordinatus]|uniref:hypothetical protein n=1 Tax=Halobellus inordinatus TaxID=1126236 RepID=UPI00210E691F|nr:hypothetical protein [Halobellus inordinatus]
MSTEKEFPSKEGKRSASIEQEIERRFVKESNSADSKGEAIVIGTENRLSRKKEPSLGPSAFAIREKSEKELMLNLEERLSDVEYQLEEAKVEPQLRKYSANDSFQSAVKDSLLSGGVLNSEEVLTEVHSGVNYWDQFDKETKNKIRFAPLEPIHDIIVLFGVVLSSLATVFAAVTGLYSISVLFIVIGMFLFYSYWVDIGE